VFKRVLRRADETEKWKKLRNEELHNFYPSSNIICVIKSRMRWERYVELMMKMINAYNILVGKHEGNTPFSIDGGEMGINTDVKETGCEGADWIRLAQDRVHFLTVVNTVMKGWYWLFKDSAPWC
jgi:hypothetical protein